MHRAHLPHRAPSTWRLSLLTVLVAACTSTSTPAPAQRTWKVLAKDIPQGALMAGVVQPSGLPLLVGGQTNLGAVWTLENAQLHADATVPAGPLLAWVSQLEDGTALVVGNGRRALWRAMDGTWTAESLPDGDELWGCKAFARDDAWAVGGNIAADKITATPILLHRTASGWTTVPLPKLTNPAVRLFKVDAQSPSDIVVVGDEGEVLHYNGIAWTEEASGTGENLTTVRALPDGRYVAVGGRSTGVVRMRGTDGKWQKLRDVESGLSGVDVWNDAVWTCGSTGWLESVAMDGSRADIVDALTTDDLHLMLRLPTGDAIAGGGNFAAWQSTMHGTLLAWTFTP